MRDDDGTFRAFRRFLRVESELSDEHGEVGAEFREIICRELRLVGARCSAFSSSRNAGGVFVDFACSAGCLLNGAGDLVGGEGLFVDGGSDALLEGADFEDDVVNFGDGHDGAASVALDGVNTFGDVLGCEGGVLGKLFHFGCDNGEPLTGLAGASGLDGGIECEEVGLFGDRVDQFDHLADFGAAGAQFGNGIGGGLRGLDCVACDFDGLCKVSGDFADADGHFLCGDGGAFDVFAQIGGDGCDGMSLSGCHFGVTAH